MIRTCRGTRRGDGCDGVGKDGMMGPVSRDPVVVCGQG